MVLEQRMVAAHYNAVLGDHTCAKICQRSAEKRPENGRKRLKITGVRTLLLICEPARHTGRYILALKAQAISQIHQAPACVYIIHGIITFIPRSRFGGWVACVHSRPAYLCTTRARRWTRRSPSKAGSSHLFIINSSFCQHKTVIFSTKSSFLIQNAPKKPPRGVHSL